MNKCKYHSCAIGLRKQYYALHVHWRNWETGNSQTRPMSFSAPPPHKFTRPNLRRPSLPAPQRTLDQSTLRHTTDGVDWYYSSGSRQQQLIVFRFDCLPHCRSLLNEIAAARCLCGRCLAGHVRVFTASKGTSFSCRSRRRWSSLCRSSIGKARPVRAKS